MDKFEEIKRHIDSDRVSGRISNYGLFRYDDVDWMVEEIERCRRMLKEGDRYIRQLIRMAEECVKHGGWLG